MNSEINYEDESRFNGLVQSRTAVMPVLMDFLTLSRVALKSKDPADIEAIYDLAANTWRRLKSSMDTSAQELESIDQAISARTL